MASVVSPAGALDASADRSAPMVDANADLHRRVHAAVNAQYDAVWRSLRRFGVDEASAADAAQQVFCVFADRAGEVPEAKVRSFLLGVALRTAQNARRVRGRRPDLASLDGDDDAWPSASSGPDALLEQRDARQLLDRLLARMPLDLRSVFVLYEIEELTTTEIAGALDLPSGTVASRLRRARALFQELVREAEVAR